MFKVELLIEGEWYTYGTYNDRDWANEVAMMVRDERDCEVYVEEV